MLRITLACLFLAAACIYNTLNINKLHEQVTYLKEISSEQYEINYSLINVIEDLIRLEEYNYEKGVKNEHLSQNWQVVHNRNAWNNRPIGYRCLPNQTGLAGSRCSFIY